jgi:precorrin-6A/cobalt-precorrin-6A reductase
VLVLAGTTEATELARLLADDGLHVISSLAGVTGSPLPRAGEVRSGGFGGTAGLAAYLTGERIDLVVDATHPFAAVMPFHAAAAAKQSGVPHLRLLREPWRPQPGDRWIEVADLSAAATIVEEIGERVFLAIGRNSLEPFAACTGPWFLVRSVDPVTTILANSLSIRDRGPFRFEREMELLDEHAIDTVVAKNAGGQASIAKLEAARALGITVVMVHRPPGPAGVLVVSSAMSAAEWVRSQVDLSSP